MPDQDLNEKQKLEKQFEDIAASIFGMYLSQFRRSVQQDRGVPPASLTYQDFRFSLDRHYRRTQNVFRSLVFEGIDPVEENGEAQDLFDSSMDAWRKRVSEERAALISETNVLEAEESLKRAAEDIEAAGEVATPFALAALSSLSLKRKFDQRKKLISVMETQAAAESTKFLKTEAITNTPVLMRGFLTFKNWHTRIDGRERPSHHNANNQERPAAEAFQVGGSKLQYPGDPSAPIRETAKCRCYITSKVVPI